MTKIHGIAYILVGAIVSFVSWKINFNNLIIFFYAGIAFGVIGLFKIFIDLARKNEDSKKQANEKQHHIRHAGGQNAQNMRNSANIQSHPRAQSATHVQQHNQKQAHPHNQTKQQYKRCQNCGNTVRMHDNFCPNCGYNV